MPCDSARGVDSTGELPPSRELGRVFDGLPDETSRGAALTYLFGVGEAFDGGASFTREFSAVVKDALITGGVTVDFVSAPG